MPAYPEDMAGAALSDTLSAAQRKRRAIMISVLVATALTVLKLVVWMATHSVAMLSETLHSLTDLAAVLLAMTAIRRTTAPPDARYRYGYGRAENLSALAEGSLVIIAALAIAVEAARSLVHPHHLHTPLLATATMGLAAACCLGLAWFLRREARALDSPALAADSQHVLVDVYSAAGVGAGLALVSATGIQSLDAVIAILVAALVVRLGQRLVRDALGVLQDQSLADDDLTSIRQILQRPLPGVTGYHRLRTRRSGARRHVDLHMTFDPDLTIERAHSLASEVEERLEQAFPDLDVVIHLEPDQEAPQPGEDDRPLKPQSGLSMLPGHSFERKFLLVGEPSYRQLADLGAEVTEIEQHYLSGDKRYEERVRRRWSSTGEAMSWTRKDTTPGLDRELEERQIDRPEYERLLARRDLSRYPIRKTRYSFEWAGNLCEVDVFALPVRLYVMEVEMPSEDAELALPSFVTIEREVTEDEQFLNAAIARRLADQQALPRQQWLDHLAPGDAVWVSARSRQSDTGGYGEIVRRDQWWLTVSLREQEVVFDRQGRASAAGAELRLERPGESLR
jgi:cation diffusion facilitator family transporter